MVDEYFLPHRRGPQQTRQLGCAEALTRRCACSRLAAPVDGM